MKLEDLKKPFRFENAKVIKIDPGQLSEDVQSENGEITVLGPKGVDDVINTVIGLRVEAAHAMGTLKGYRLAMRDLKDNFNILKTEEK